MVKADSLSKHWDNTAWSLGHVFYQWALRRLGVRPEEVNINPFSDGVNHRGPVWFSRVLAPGCAGMDGFSQKWRDGRPNAPERSLAFVHGPFNLMGRILRKVSQEQCDCIVVTPGLQAEWAAQLQNLPVVQSVKIPGSIPGSGQAPRMVPGSRVSPECIAKISKRNNEIWAHLIRWGRP